MLQIPFNRPTLAGTEIDNVLDAIDRGQLSGDGHYTRLCHAWLEREIGVRKALLTHSCTAALEMAAMLIDLAEGDEVIMPSYTFVSTANAVVLRGAVPVFVDIDPDTLNIAPVEIEKAITPRTKAIFVVHYAGVPCDMDRIDGIAAAYGLAVVEDAAQAFGSTYKGVPAGRLGSLSAFSFHETKNITSGEGGFLGINDPALAERAEIIREKGTNRSRFFRGEVDRYTWVDVGSSYLPGEMVAAFLYGQLEQAQAITEGRLALWRRYDEALRPAAVEAGIGVPAIPSDRSHNGHIYHLVFPSPADRAEFIRVMKEQGIMTPFHYVPLHSSPAGRRFGRQVGTLAVTEAVSDGLVRLPLHRMDHATQDRVIAGVKCYIETRR